MGACIPHLAPLILVPAQIVKTRLNQDSNCYSYVISFLDEDLETNLSLAEKLRQDYDLILPDLCSDTSQEAYFEEINSKVIRHKRRWQLKRDMVLDLFSFAKTRMYKDLDDAIWPPEAKLTANRNLRDVLAGRDELEDYTAFHQVEYDIDREPLAQNIQLVLDADSSQHSAVIGALHGDNNLVIEGPPGTGKSQTIANIIASALGMGKSVLFVAEKKAALDVVRTRLEKVGLGDFCFELHNHKTQKSKLHLDLRTRLNKTFEDSLKLEQELEDLKSERDKLLHYSQLLNSGVGPNGDRVFQLFWAVERWRAQLPADTPCIQVIEPLALTRKQINERAILLQDIARLGLELPQEVRTAWQGFTPTSYLPGDQNKVAGLLNSIAVETAACLNEVKILESQGAFPFEPTVLGIRHLSESNVELFGQAPLPFDSQLTLHLTDQNAVNLVRQFDKALQEHRRLLTLAQDVLDISILTDEISLSLLESTTYLVEAGYGDNSATGVVAFTHGLSELQAVINNAIDVAAAIPFLAERPITTLADVFHLQNIINVIGKAPLDLAICCHSSHAHESSFAILQKARKECTSLMSEQKELESIFTFNLIPSSDTVLSLARVARGLPHPLIASFMPSSWQFNSKVREFLKPGVNIPTRELAVRLEQAATILTRIQQIAVKRDYCHLLGPLFKGVDTDWDRLGRLVAWSQGFGRIVGSHKRAMALLSRTPELLDISNRFATLLNQAVTSVKDIHFDVDPAVGVDIVSKRIDRTIAASISVEQSVSEVHVRGHKSILSIKCGIEAYQAARSLESAIDTNQTMIDLLGHHFAGTETDSGYLMALVDWLSRMQDEGHFTIDLLCWMVADNSLGRLQAVSTFIGSSRLYLQSFMDFYNSISRYGVLDFETFFFEYELEITHSHTLHAVNLAAKYVDHLTKWADYCHLVNRAEAQGLHQFITFIKQQGCSPDDAYAFYQFAASESMAREVMKTCPLLASFSRSSIEAIVQRFASLDKAILETTSKRIAHKLSNNSIPSGQSGVKVSSLTELSLIKHEINKQKKHLPIRQLVSRAGKALQTLKPCFMMSPLTVAQFIAPGSIHFDLVVMDEASQLKPEDALGAIARGTKLIVVGDPRQLPPTNFFDRLDGNFDEDATLVEEAESFLDRCMQMYPSRRLRWHYRSEHESLIAFSNVSFYGDNPLFLFPSPYRSSRYYGVHFHYVQGAQYKKGHNLLEAQTVANAVKEHFSQCPGQSLGVAAFNREQSNLIQELLEKLQKENPHFDLQLRASLDSSEPFFVKNLENVQGDERDVIFISTTYGPDPSTGRVFQRFGPLSGDTGWRRLNVIITRAKHRVEVFSSMQPSDITPTEGTKRGVHALKAYLEYASTGVLPDCIPHTGFKQSSDFEEVMLKVLRDLGYSAVTQVGVAGFAIDIGVKHPKREGDFILGIECDGTNYHSAKSVSDRDRIRQEILQSKGWRIHRIWSIDWFKNREVEINRLREAIDDALRYETAQESEKIFDREVASTRSEQQLLPLLEIKAVSVVHSEYACLNNLVPLDNSLIDGVLSIV